MLLRDFINSGINLEGYIKVQCWENEDNPTIYCEGNNHVLDIPEEYMDREIIYIFPYMENDVTAAICIELAEE